MQNPFYNHTQQRPRALFRILLFVLLFILAMAAPTFIPSTVIDYLVKSFLVFGIFYGMIQYVDRRPWALSGLTFNQIWIKECVAGITIAGTVMGLIFLTEWLSGSLIITGYGWERSANTFWVIPLLVFFVQMISVGFYEEVMARGYLIPNITEGFSFGKITPKHATIIAVIISSAIFGVAHASNPNASITAVINILIAGVMLAVPFIITGRLALSVGLHFSWNFFQGGVFGFRVSGMEFRNSIVQIQQQGADWWTGGAFGPEAGVIGILGIILILGLSILYLKKTGVPLGYSELFSTPFEEND